ncbi:hypothetical protein RRG08_021685 [Elysia crispata]|uniref:BRCT domain-containing protein n=1 Tax=Elysia crispata TaxID=231223 RepID=A0AAE0ZY15_9GAST|nr:hypothetical protein RRG08_021685 [Elysia crispata]
MATVLKGVVAFVEVRSSNDNRSAAIAHELSQLGAKVETTFSDEVTHVVYKEGLKRTWNRATKRGVPMVSVSWIDSCKQHLSRMPESAFPALLPEESDSPFLRINHTSRWKKMRSMQPCDFEEEIARSAERGEKRRKRVMMANKFKLSEEATPRASPAPILAMETQPRSLMCWASSHVGSPVPDTPPSMKERLERMRREQLNVLQDELSTQTPKTCYEKPLQKRLFERLASDFASNGTSSDEEQENSSDIVKQLIQRLDSDDGEKLNSSSKQNFKESLTEGLGSKPLCSKHTANTQKNLPDANFNPNTPTMKQNCRRSLRVSSGRKFIPVHSDCAAVGETSKEVLIKEPEAEQNGKRKLTSHSPDKPSLALSPKDINICISREKVCQANSPRHRHKGNDLVQDTFIPDLVDNAAKKPSLRKESENSGLQSIQRRRSSRNSMNSKHSPEIKSVHCYQPDPKLSKDKVLVPSSESLRKKRTLYTEPVMDMSLPKPLQSKNASKISDAAFFFETLEKDDSPAKNGSNRRKNKSSASANNRHKKFTGQKSFDLSSNESISNDTLGNSMSIVYGGDTHLSSETKASKSRRSINEFRLTERMFKRTKNRGISEKSKLAQIKEAEQVLRITESGSQQAAPIGMGKPKVVNAKRSRDTDSSCDSAEAISSKKQKLSSSESEDRFSSPQQLDHFQPRLRHARSLVMETPQSVSVEGVQYSIVVTSLHREEQELVYSVLKKLGVFHLTNSVEWSSTHIVCGEPRRTLNLLKAIARGCWILSKEWVFKSLEAGAWLAEESFEMDKELPVVKKSRLARHTAGDDFRLDLFSNIGLIFVAGGCKPPRKELVHLIQLCSGRVTGTQSKASLCIGEISDSNKRFIKPSWILDSIMKLECLPVEDYIVPAQKALFSQREKFSSNQSQEHILFIYKNT